VRQDWAASPESIFQRPVFMESGLPRCARPRAWPGIVQSQPEAKPPLGPAARV